MPLTASSSGGGGAGQLSAVLRLGEHHPNWPGSLAARLCLPVVKLSLALEPWLAGAHRAAPLLPPGCCRSRPGSPSQLSSELYGETQMKELLAALVCHVSCQQEGLRGSGHWQVSPCGHPDPLPKATGLKVLGVSRQVSGGSGKTLVMLSSSSILGSTCASLHRSPWLATQETPNLQPDPGDRSFAFIARLFLQTCSI